MVRYCGLLNPVAKVDRVYVVSFAGGDGVELLFLLQLQIRQKDKHTSRKEGDILGVMVVKFLAHG
jgi:hypothetical protein